MNDEMMFSLVHAEAGKGDTHGQVCPPSGARGPVVTIGTLWEVLFVDTVLYPSDYGRHQGAHICIYLEWGLHDEYGEPE